MLEEVQGDVSVEFCKYTLYHVVKTLAYLHSQNIAYRDVKSDNVLCNSEGEIKLCDFGYSTIASTEKQTWNDKVGTVCWMAPELIDPKSFKVDSYTFKVDVWSLGIFAIELATGEPPWITEHATRVLFNIV